VEERAVTGCAGQRSLKIAADNGKAVHVSASIDEQSMKSDPQNGTFDCAKEESTAFSWPCRKRRFQEPVRDVRR
jgi:hypothetical protein